MIPETGIGAAQPAPAGARSFHARLRAETANCHAATEAAFSAFASRPAERVGWFLSAQLIALRAIDRARAGPAPEEEGSLLPDLLAALAADCTDRGHAPLPDLAPVAPMHTLGVAYLVLGARLGTAVLADRLRAEQTAMPRAFLLTGPRGGWRALRARLDAIDPDSAAAAAITAAARRGFDIHRAAAALAPIETTDSQP